MKFPKVKRCKADTQKGMIQILDKVFSEYIRRRDAGGSEYARCITCPAVKPWNQGDAGHFVNRNHLSTRWHEKNVNFQCPSCNRFKGGEQHLHGLAIDRKYGKGTAEQLQAISRSHAKVDIQWLKFHISEYRKKLKEMC